MSIETVPETRTQHPSNGPAERFEFTEEYVLRLRSRDPATWQHFDRFFRPRICAKLRAKLPWNVAEELSGEIMLAVIESIDRGEPRDASCLAGYVFSICHNKMLEAWRKIGKENIVDFDFETLRETAKTPLQQCLGDEEARKIQKVLSKLSRKDREILVSIYYHGQDRQDVCEKYRVTREHLKMILFHARQRFQKEWERT
jgi:RNA polymerase sigma factor (sigma-70 family)